MAGLEVISYKSCLHYSFDLLVLRPLKTDSSICPPFLDAWRSLGPLVRQVTSYNWDRTIDPDVRRAQATPRFPTTQRAAIVPSEKPFALRVRYPRHLPEYLEGLRQGLPRNRRSLEKKRLLPRLAVYQLLNIERDIPPVTPYDKSLSAQVAALIKSFK